MRKQLAPWFGGKATLAPKIVTQLGDHKVFIETFCGSMAVLFAKPRCRIEIVNDLHSDIINLSRIVQDNQLHKILVKRLEKTLYHEDAYREASSKIKETFIAKYQPSIDRAYWYFVVSWMGRGGVAGSKGAESSGFRLVWDSKSGNLLKFRSAIDSISQWHDRLRHAAITRRDAFSVIERARDDEECSIYVDPPYIYKQRISTHGRGQYLHDIKNDHDHERLAKLLKRFKKARVVVSYYDCRKIRKLYKGWNIIKCYRKKSMTFTRTNKNYDDAREILLVNGPIFSEGNA